MILGAIFRLGGSTICFTAIISPVSVMASKTDPKAPFPSMAPFCQCTVWVPSRFSFFGFVFTFFLEIFSFDNFFFIWTIEDAVAVPPGLPTRESSLDFGSSLCFSSSYHHFFKFLEKLFFLKTTYQVHLEAPTLGLFTKMGEGFIQVLL